MTRWLSGWIGRRMDEWMAGELVCVGKDSSVHGSNDLNDQSTDRPTDYTDGFWGIDRSEITVGFSKQNDTVFGWLGEEMWEIIFNDRETITAVGLVMNT